MALVKSTGEKINNFKDYTQQCTFKNCDLLGGKIYKLGKIAIFQIVININTSNIWDEIIEIPNDLLPLNAYDNGAHISGTNFWVYKDKTIKGELTANTKANIFGFYICEK